MKANEKMVDTKDLVLAVNKNFVNKKAADIIKSGISKINPEKIISDYMAKHMK